MILFNYNTVYKLKALFYFYIDQLTFTVIYAYYNSISVELPNIFLLSLSFLHVAIRCRDSSSPLRLKHKCLIAEPCKPCKLTFIIAKLDTLAMLGFLITLAFATVSSHADEISYVECEPTQNGINVNKLQLEKASYIINCKWWMR